jgi:uncharacterized protein YyaL (SSP411 family)
LGSLQQAFSRYPTAFGHWLNALDMAVGPLIEIAVLGDVSDPAYKALRVETFARYLPRCVVAASSYPPPPGSPPLLAGRPLVGGQPAAYVCTGFVCQRPVTTPEDLRQQLETQPAPG